MTKIKFGIDVNWDPRTVKQVKAHLRDNWVEGTACPCCGQYVKLYRRKLNSGMARTLILIYHHHPIGWVNVKGFLREHNFQNNHDWTLLSYWGFIVERENTDPQKKSSGEWRMTDKGRDFVRRNLRAPSHIKIYNNEFLGFDGTEITILEALGKRFDYRELMKS